MSCYSSNRRRVRAAAFTLALVLTVSSCEISRITGAETSHDDSGPSTPPDNEPAPETPTAPGDPKAPPAAPNPIAAAVENAIFLYMHADASNRSEAIETINQLEAAQLGGNTKILALVHFEPGSGATEEPQGTYFYNIEADTDPNAIGASELSLPSLDLEAGAENNVQMGRAETLSAFLFASRALFAASYETLILWNAGGVPQAATAETSPDRLTIDEVRIALASGAPDLIALDTPSGAMAEIAYELRATGALLLASQSYAASPGMWNYTALAETLAGGSPDPQAMATALVDSLSISLQHSTQTTLSAIATAETPTLTETLDTLSLALLDELSDETERNAIRDLLFYDVADFYGTPGDLNLDLAAAAMAIADEIPSLSGEAAAVAEAVDDAVLAHWQHPATEDDAYGLSIHYIPLDDYGYPIEHHRAYTGEAGHPTLAFFATAWPPDMEEGDGLLYRLWYHPF